MTDSAAPEVRPLRGAGLLRALHAVLPLGRKYHPLLTLLNGRHGLAALPFALTTDSASSVEVTNAGGNGTFGGSITWAVGSSATLGTTH